MKNLILVLAAVLCAQSAFAQSDDYDEVVQPIPVPAGEKALDMLNEIKITAQAQLVTYRADGKLTGRGQTVAYDLGRTSPVNCELSGVADASNFKEVARHNPGSGIRFTVVPKKSITLEFQSSLVGVEEMKPSCNGEPEICSGQTSYYNYRSVITLEDKSGSKWKLSCLAPFSRELYVSDVKINGLKIK